MTFAPLIPELYVTDRARSLSFYADVLGFSVAYSRPDGGLALSGLGGAQLMLEQTRSLESAPFQGGKKKPLESRRAYLFP